MEANVGFDYSLELARTGRACESLAHCDRCIYLERTIRLLGKWIGNNDGWVVREKCPDKVYHVEILQCVERGLINARRSLKAVCRALHSRWAPHHADN